MGISQNTRTDDDRAAETEPVGARMPRRQEGRGEQEGERGRKESKLGVLAQLRARETSWSYCYCSYEYE